MHSTHRFRRTIASLAIASVALVPVACSSGSGTSRAATTTVHGTSTSASHHGSTGAEPAAGNTYGFWVEGDSGTMQWKTERVVGTGNRDHVPTEGTWVLDGEPRWQLFNSSVAEGAMTFTLDGGTTATVSVIRGKASDPDDPAAGIDVAETLEKQELTSGESVTLAFP